MMLVARCSPWTTASLGLFLAACSAIPCPGDLVSGEGGRCACPAGTIERETPAFEVRGEPTYCVAPVPPTPTGRGEPEPEQPVDERDAGEAPAPGSTDMHDAGMPGEPPAPPVPGTARPPSPQCTPTVETCDQADNDCDGAIDESIVCAPPPPPSGCSPVVWYRDCDGDGFAPGRGGSASGCAEPEPAVGCRGWTNREPIAGQIDCDDGSATYAPGADYGAAGLGNGDRNCDGVLERKVRRVLEPRIVEHKPRDDARFCRYDLDHWAGCECFNWDITQWEGEAEPPCATSIRDTIVTAYKYWYGSEESRSCQGAVTVETASVDYYELLQTCR